jgi:RNA polymerase sigma factor (sigma-70 family)
VSVQMSSPGSPEDRGGTSTLYDRPSDIDDDLAELDTRQVGEQFAAGDQTALAEAYRRWSPLVYTLALRTLSQQSEAEDVTQRVFIQAWRSRENFDPNRRPLPAWLVGITRHVVSDRMSERSREWRLQKRVATADPPAVEVDDGIADRVADAVVVADGLSRLEQPRRRVVEMSFFDGLTHSQIADSLGLPLGTVKSHIKRGLAQLKTHLEVSSSDGTS